MPIHTAVARNFAAASENRIHSDEVARRFGFTGALVVAEMAVAVMGQSPSGLFGQGSASS